MDRDNIFYAIQNGVCLIKMVGEIRHTISAGLDGLVERLPRCNKAIQDVVIDLRQTTYLDSTNLGLLAGIARFMQETFQRKATILSDDEDVLILLDSMGFLEVFHVIERPEQEIEVMEELPGADHDERQKAQMVFKAHRDLMELNEKNRLAFRTLVEMLDRELKGT